jgi:hypothetical protein
MQMGCSSCNRKKIREQQRMPKRPTKVIPIIKSRHSDIKSVNDRKNQVLINRKTNKLPSRPRNKLR